MRNIVGQFNLEDKNYPINFIRIKTDWKISPGTIPTYLALVEDAKLATPAGLTLSFKQGAVLSLIADIGLCIYRDDDLK